MSRPTSNELLEMLILCPTGQDGTLITNALNTNGVAARNFATISELGDRARQGCGGIIIAEEVLNKEAITTLNSSISKQEAWSDIPIIVLTTREGKYSTNQLVMIQSFTSSGNVTLIERPMRPMTLMSTVQVALRSRKRQYQVRDLLISQAEATIIRDEFISIASHELKTPLTSLKLQAQMTSRLLDKSPENLEIPKISKFLSQTLNQLERLNKLVDDMLDVSRISSGKLSVNKESFDLSELLHEVIERFAPQFKSYNCDLDLDIQTSVIGMWDPFKIEQVINNLFTNILKYAPGKPVHIKLNSDSSHAYFTVKDQGPGISSDNLERIFERFERVESLASARGLGLGLFITRQIIDLHSGSIEVSSEVGQGTTFAIKLPLGI